MIGFQTPYLEMGQSSGSSPSDSVALGGRWLGIEIRKEEGKGGAMRMGYGPCCHIEERVQKSV